MRCVGMLAGVGSLLWEAREAGFDITANVETRTPYRTGRKLSWDLNFSTVPLFTTDDASEWEGLEAPDLMLGHPPCNSHSQLGNNAVRAGMSDDEKAFRKARRAARTGLLPLFIKGVHRLRPKMFALDNLPKILKTVATPTWWNEQLPQYHMTYIIMKNWDYGTPQLRERLWVVGCRRPLKRFVFTPPRTRLKGPKTAAEALHDLDWRPWHDEPEWGHVHKQPHDFPAGGYRDTTRYKLQRQTELALGFLQLPPRHLWIYKTEGGRIGAKFGRVRLDAFDRSSVLSGLETIHHPLTGWPLTPRERARLMDWPDDFQLGNAGTTYDRSSLMRLTLFTGKAVPSGFPRYLIPQLISHLKRRS